MFKYPQFLKTLLTENCMKIISSKCSYKYMGTHTTSTVGFIGLGAMGSHMARNLLKKYEVYVYDVSDTAAASLARDGAKVVARPEDLGHLACVVSMLPASQNVLDVYDGPQGLISKIAPHSLIIDSSTVDPAVSQQLSAAAAQRGVTFLDAPVSGGILAAEAGRLTFMVGGTVEGVKAGEPVLRAMGSNVIHCGEAGRGQVAKLCNNVLLAVSMVATAEAMNLGIRLGMDAKVLACIINSSSGRCWSSDTYNPVPGVLPGVPASNNYQGGFLSRLMLKDLNLAQTVAQRNGAPTPFAEQALQVYKDICDQGKAGLDFSVVYQHLKELESKKS